MPEINVAPDAEGITVAFLRSELTQRSQPDKVYVRVPSPAPDHYVRLSMVGGGRRDVAHETARLLVEVFGLTTATTSYNARIVRALLLHAPQLAPSDFLKVEDGGGPAFLPDPDTNKPRYQFIVTVHQRVAPIE